MSVLHDWVDILSPNPDLKEIYLTADQIDRLRLAAPPPIFSDLPGPRTWAQLTGTPIVEVATVEESTPYQRGLPT